MSFDSNRVAIDNKSICYLGLLPRLTLVREFGMHVSYRQSAPHPGSCVLVSHKWTTTRGNLSVH